MLFALSLSGTAIGIEYVPASSIQQNTLQLRSDVAALRSALAKGGTDPHSILAAYAPKLQERARAARVSAEQFELQIQSSQSAAAYKRAAAEAENYVRSIEELIQQLATQVTQVDESRRKLELAAQRIEEVLPKILAMVSSDPASVPQVCALPHAVTMNVSGTCAIAACEKGWLNADGKASNGCEVPVPTLALP